MSYAAVIASMHSFVTMPQASTSVAVSHTGTTVSKVGIIRAKRTRMAMSSARTYEIRGCNRALIMASKTIRFSRSEANNKSAVSICLPRNGASECGSIGQKMTESCKIR